MTYRPFDLAAALAGLTGSAPPAPAEAPPPERPRVLSRPLPPAPADRPGWAAWWQEGMRVRAAHGPVVAERRTWGEALYLWHLHHGQRPQAGRCGACGERADPARALALWDGAAVHWDDGHGFRCLAAYGRTWRIHAAAALAALGIFQPEGVHDDE